MNDMAGSRIARAVFTEPFTWAAVGLVVALVAAMLWWFRPPLTMSSITLGLGLLALAFWAVLLIRSEPFVCRLFNVPESVKAHEAAKLRQIENDFGDLHFPQGVAQLRHLQDKIRTFEGVLQRRLQAGELTYGRYLAIAEQVYLSALDNLHEIAVTLQSASGIDADYIRSRLDELRETASPTEDHERAVTALSERNTLLQTQHQRVVQLLAQNESAMTVLDKTAAALAQTKIGRGEAKMDAEAAMKELERLAGRIGAYAHDA